METEQLLQRLEEAITRAGEAGDPEPHAVTVGWRDDAGNLQACSASAKIRGSQIAVTSESAVDARAEAPVSLCFFWGALKEQVTIEGRRAALSPDPETWFLRPERFEFWSDRRFRLHERECFERKGDGWAKSRLYP